METQLYKVEDFITPKTVNGIFDTIIHVTEKINNLELERLENEQIIEKVWADAVSSGDIVPGKNDDLRAAQKRDRCPDESDEIDRIDEELRGYKNDLGVLRLQKERIDYLLRFFGR